MQASATQKSLRLLEFYDILKLREIKSDLYRFPMNLEKQKIEAGIPQAVAIEECACPLCGEENGKEIVRTQDKITNLPGSFKVIECIKCGLYRTNPRPTLSAISYYYPSDSYIPLQETKRKPTKIGVLLGSFFEFNLQKIPKVRGMRLLEIGCGTGEYLKKMQDKGWQVEGLEPSVQAAEIAKRNTDLVYVSQIESLILPPEKQYDLIIGWTVFEHLHEPIKCLEKMKFHLRSEGFVVLSMPNVATFMNRKFPSYNLDWDVPRHLFHYDAESIKKIAHATGYEVVNIFHHRVLSNVIATFGYYLKDKSKERSSLVSRFSLWCIEYPDKAGLAHILLYPLAFLLAHLRQTGRMTVWLKIDKESFVKPNNI